MNKKIIIAAGGTGGHLFPAIATANQLSTEISNIDIVFMAGKLASNPYFSGASFSIHSISCGSITSKNPITLIKNLFGMGRGVLESRKFINNFKPDLVVGFGSYHAFPALLAAKWEGIPILLHESNSIPGKVNRLLSPHVHMTCVQFPVTQKLIKGKSVVVEMPLRDGYRKGTTDRNSARAYFGLNPAKKTLLVFGGSQGAQAINQLISNSQHDFQLIHVTGSTQSAVDIDRLYQERGVKACVKSFETRMDLAWQAADLAVCRSGAGTIAEQIEFEVPAIFIPYPHAADDHQKVNADFVVKTVGGAVVFNENELNSEKLSIFLRQIPLDAMKRAIGNYKQNKAAAGSQIDFCSIIKNVLNEQRS